MLNAWAAQLGMLESEGLLREIHDSAEAFRSMLTDEYVEVVDALRLANAALAYEQGRSQDLQQELWALQVALGESESSSRRRSCRTPPPRPRGAASIEARARRRPLPQGGGPLPPPRAPPRSAGAADASSARAATRGRWRSLDKDD